MARTGQQLRVRTAKAMAREPSARRSRRRRRRSRGWATGSATCSTTRCRRGTPALIAWLTAATLAADRRLRHRSLTIFRLARAARRATASSTSSSTTCCTRWTPAPSAATQGTWALPAHDAGADPRRPVHRQRPDRRARQRHRHQAGRPAPRPLDRPRGGPHGHPRLVGVDLHDHLRADPGQREPQGRRDRDPRRPGQGRHGGGAQGQGARAPGHPDRLPLRLADGPRRPAAEQPRDGALGDPAGARLRRPRLRGHQDPPRADPQRSRGAADRGRDPGPEQPRGRRAGRQGPDHPARHPRDRRQAGRADLAPVRRRRRLHRAVRLLRRRVLLLRGPRRWPGRRTPRRSWPSRPPRSSATSTAACPS